MTRSFRFLAGVPALFVALLVAAAPTSAQQTADFIPEAVRGQPFELSVRSIMRGEEIVGQSPSRISWSADSETIYFGWVPGGFDWNAPMDWWRVPAEGGEPERVPDEDLMRLEIVTSQGEMHPDGRRMLITHAGDLYLLDTETLEYTRLTHTAENESAIGFAQGGDAVRYRQGLNVYEMGLDGGGVTQLTDLRSGNAPTEDSEPEGLDAFLRDQQLELFEHIRRENREDSIQEARREARTPEGPETIFLGDAGVASFNDELTFATVRAFAEGGNGERVPVPFWVTESGYTEPQDTRTKVGDASGTSRAGVLNLDTGEKSWVEGAPDDFEGVVSANALGWNDAGTHFLVMGSSDDDENRWLWSVEAATGERTLLDHRFDSAWVGGPCGFCIGWYPGQDRVYFSSEETGYAHLYAIDADGTDRVQLTSGEWEVLSANLDEDEGRFFLTTYESSPFDQHSGWMSLDGGEIDYLTEGTGRFDLTLSPDGERVAVLHDVANRPPELFVAPADDVMAMEQVTTTPTEQWRSFDWIQPEIVMIPARDGVEVPARIYRPEDVGAEPNGAGVIFVHGAGYLHNVHNWWSSYYREYMFHHLLAAQGYTVLDIDYRGSAGYGRDWRTAIYRHMGGKDLYDQEDGARWMVANEGVDPDRIGLYGGSYGGFITLMAPTTGDQLFKSGAALRSVTDWAHYNDGYTSNILNDPQEDREAYVRSSPIYHVENFRPDQYMLILHGMVDTNVHFSDVVRYAQRLIELGKENWEFAVYPVENHGFTEPASWTDEYRRIFELFERTISAPGCTEGGNLCAVPGR